MSEDEEIIQSMDIKSLITNALKDENYRLAIRYHYLYILQQLELKKIIDWELQKTNHDYQREIKDKQLDPFTLDDVWKLIDAADGQFKLILTVLFFTGMRTGEMVTLKWSDIDWNNETIHIQRANNSSHEIGTTKTGTSRKVTILPIVMDALREQYKDTGLQGGFIFLAQDGGRYKTYNTFRKYHWKNLLLRTGYAYRKFYQTRHTFASIMLSKGEDIMWVSKIMLGHSEVATTYKFYAKYIKSKDKKHAAFLDDERTNSVQNINLNLGSA
jgi:integrase